MQAFLSNPALDVVKIIVDAIAIVSSAVVSIFVLLVTLRSEKRRSKENLEAREKEFKIQLEQEQRNHEESLAIQKESARISCLPFLHLNQSITIGDRNGYPTFRLAVENVGNGMALDVTVKIETGLTTYPTVCRRMCGNQAIEYNYTDILSTNTLAVGQEASFEFLVRLFEQEKQIPWDKEKMFGQCNFRISFKDSFYNQYEQDYMFQYHVVIGIGRVETSLPRLVEKNV